MKTFKHFSEGTKEENKQKSLFARYKDLQNPRDPKTTEKLLRKGSA